MTDSAEAQLRPVLSTLGANAVVEEGQYTTAYSGFEGVDEDGCTLADILSTAGIEAVDVVGLAKSHCVKDTTLDVAQQGYRVRALTDLVEPVSPELGRATRVDISATGIKLVLPR